MGIESYLRILGLLFLCIAACDANYSDKHKSGLHEITRFTILGVDGDIRGTSIALTVPFGTHVTNIAPIVTISGAGVSPASGVPQDFTRSRQLHRHR